MKRIILSSVSTTSLLLGGIPALKAETLRSPYSPAANNGGGANPGRADIITIKDATDRISGDYDLRGTSSPRFTANMTTLAQRQAAGEIVSGYEDIDGKGVVRLSDTVKRTSVTYPDAIQGTRVATAVYTNDLLTEIAGSSASTINYLDTGRPVYGDLRLADISGSTVTIATGAKTKSAYDNANFAILRADSGSTLYNISNGSAVTYDSVSAVMNGRDQDGLVQAATQAYSVPITRYSGVRFGQNDAVTDLASLKRYNSTLIAQLSQGAITPAEYESLIKAAAPTTTEQVVVRNRVIPRYTAPATTSGRLFMLLDGSNLVTTVDSKMIGVAETDGNVSGDSTLVRAQNGSSIVNNGLITQAQRAPGIVLSGTGTSLLNTQTGVIGVGYERLDRTSTVLRPTGLNERGYATDNIAVSARDGATVSNQGIINVANRDIPGETRQPSLGKANSGIVAGSGSYAENSGTILIGGGSSAVANTLGSFHGATGLASVDGGRAVNAVGGTIRVGTSFAESAAELANIVDVTSINYTSGMASLAGGGTIVNDGTIRLGSLVQNGNGMTVGGTGNTAINNGAIIIDASAVAGPSARNAAISVLGSDVANALNATNNGLIDISGVNSVGLLVENGVAGGSARAANNGIIAINGGISVDGLRNYGIFVGNDQSSAQQNGSIVLVGGGAIGVHARNGGTIDAGPMGTVDFQGIGQIGYYALGTGSSIAAQSATLVDTASSTGFRVEDGATFRGDGLTFEVSGANAVGVVGTGASSGTTVDASGMRVTVSGAGAVGIVVEGGATGALTGTSSIALTGPNTTAALVDGQRRTLDGTAVGDPNGQTRLVSQAEISSSSNALTGYVARNSGELAHSGTINFEGVETTGILASTGASVANSGSITVGAGGRGIELVSLGLSDRVIGSNSGVIVAAGGGLANRTIAVQANGLGARADLARGANLLLRGPGSIGVQAINGGSIVLSPDMGVEFAADATDQIAFHLVGPGASVTGAPVGLDASSTGSALYRFDAGATGAFGGDAVLRASGANSAAIVAAGEGTTVTVTSSQLLASGSGATGISVFGGASATMDPLAALNLGAGAVGAKVDGRTSSIDGTLGLSIGAQLDSAAKVSGDGQGAVAYAVRNGALLNHSGSVDVSGAQAVGISISGADSRVLHTGLVRLSGSGTGVEITDGGAFDNRGSICVSTGTGISIEGAGSVLTGTGTSAVMAQDGIAALRLANGGSARTAGDFSASGSAHAVLVDIGGGPLSLGDGTITVGGMGNGLENAGDSAQIVLQNTTIMAQGSGAAVRTAVALDPVSSASLFAQGANSTGFAFVQTNGSVLNSDLVLGDAIRIEASGAGATGLRAATLGAVSLSGQISVISPNGGSAVVAGPARLVSNAGILRSASVSAPVVDLSGGTQRFVNRGDIEAATPDADAIVGGSHGQFVTIESGRVIGVVDLGAGDDSFLMTGGTMSGALFAGAGSDSAVFQGVTDVNISGLREIGGNGTADGNDVLTFDRSVTAGTRRLTGWNAVNLVNSSSLTADGNLVLASGSVTIDSSSTLFAGNAVNAIIETQGQSNATLVNGGLIDLTNGNSGATDTLTVRGNYIGQNGTIKLQTVLAGDGAPSDRLIIDGGTVSGTTALEVVNAGGLGAQTVGNGIEVVSGINGGRTTATTSGDGFTLVGQHVDAGAFEYRLYASDTTGSSESWFLRTQSGSVPSEVPTPTPSPTPTPAPIPPSLPAEEPNPPSGVVTYRVEVPLLAAVPNLLRTGDLSFLGTYHKRMGDSADVVAQGFSAPGRVWGRVIADDHDLRQGGDVRPAVNGSSLGFQLGVDLFRFGNQSGHHDVGLYIGHSDGTSRVRGFASGVENQYVGKITPKTTYAGLYWTYLANSGFYVDTVVQHSWYDGKASAISGNSVALEGTGVLASVESGIDLKLSGTWTLEPQVQVIAQGTSIDPALIPSASVSYDSAGQVTGRVGVRAKGKYSTNSGSIQPYLRANLWKGFAATDRTYFRTQAATTIISTRLGSLWGEGGAGMTWSLSPRMALYGEVDYRFSLDNRQGVSGHTTSGSVGLKLSL